MVYSGNKGTVVNSNKSASDEVSEESYFDESVLEASVGDVAEKNGGGLIWWLGALGLIVLGVVSVIFLRDEQSKKKNEDAFEIKLVE